MTSDKANHFNLELVASGARPAVFLESGLNLSDFPDLREIKTTRSWEAKDMSFYVRKDSKTVLDEAKSVPVDELRSTLGYLCPTSSDMTHTVDWLVQIPDGPSTVRLFRERITSAVTVAMLEAKRVLFEAALPGRKVVFNKTRIGKGQSNLTAIKLVSEKVLGACLTPDTSHSSKFPDLVKYRTKAGLEFYVHKDSEDMLNKSITVEEVRLIAGHLRPKAANTGKELCWSTQGLIFCVERIDDTVTNSEIESKLQHLLKSGLEIEYAKRNVIVSRSEELNLNLVLKNGRPAAELRSNIDLTPFPGLESVEVDFEHSYYVRKGTKVNVPMTSEEEGVFLGYIFPGQSHDPIKLTWYSGDVELFSEQISEDTDETFIESKLQLMSTTGIPIRYEIKKSAGCPCCKSSLKPEEVVLMTLLQNGILKCVTLRKTADVSVYSNVRIIENKGACQTVTLTTSNFDEKTPEKELRDACFLLPQGNAAMLKWTFDGKPMMSERVSESLTVAEINKNLKRMRESGFDIEYTLSPIKKCNH